MRSCTVESGRTRTKRRPPTGSGFGCEPDRHGLFDVVPVCCKIGGASSQEISGTSAELAGAPTGRALACNPLAQAAILNQRDTDINLVVGLCIGADALLTRASRAPVTTLFVKDRSLANNPIGALYSDYYLRESASPAAERDLLGDRGTHPRQRRAGSFEDSHKGSRQNVNPLLCKTQ